MKINKYFISLFLCLFALQIAVPVYMIIHRENVLRYGKQYKFRTAPVDPYDAFRGKYVALKMQEDTAPVLDNSQFLHGQKLYALIEEDRDGFSKITGVLKNRPLRGDYIKARYGYNDGSKIYLNLPFDRFYMDEKDAPLAESAYRTYSRSDKQDAYILVRIKDGSAVIEDLFINNKPILQFLKDSEE
jgi:uncharacterized membrane-anchored protein